MFLLLSADRLADQKYNTLYFLSGEQWFNLTAHDMRTSLVNAGLKIMDPRLLLGHLCPITYPLHLLHL